MGADSWEKQNAGKFLGCGIADRTQQPGVRLKRFWLRRRGWGELDLKDPRRLASAEGPGLLSPSASWAPLAQRQRHRQVDRSAQPRTSSGARKPPCSPPLWKEIQVGGGRSWRNGGAGGSRSAWPEERALGAGNPVILSSTGLPCTKPPRPLPGSKTTHISAGWINSLGGKAAFSRNLRVIPRNAHLCA